jgi:uncharacterized Zn-finger protein
MSDSEVIQSESRTVGCDGGGGALGHPLVYLDMGEKSEITCPYCSQNFALKEGAKVSSGH